MTIDLSLYLEKRQNCINNLDENKCCLTCAHVDVDKEKLPCRDCYFEVLGLPVNPTNWEVRP